MIIDSFWSIIHCHYWIGTKYSKIGPINVTLGKSLFIQKIKISRVRVDPNLFKKYDLEFFSYLKIAQTRLHIKFFNIFRLQLIQIDFFGRLFTQVCLNHANRQKCERNQQHKYFLHFDFCVNYLNCTLYWKNYFLKQKQKKFKKL